MFLHLYALGLSIGIQNVQNLLKKKLEFFHIFSKGVD